MKLVIILLFLPLVCFSQNDWEKVEASVFMDVIREYEASIPAGSNYSLETEYKIFNRYQDAQPVQSFNGKLTCRNGKELNIWQMGHFMIQDDALNLTIDTLAKEILVQRPDSSFFYRKSLQDYSTFLEMAEVVYRKSENGKIIYILELKKGYPYRSVEFAFTDKNVISQVVIYSHQPYYAEGDNLSGDGARIVLDFKNFRKGRAVEFAHFLTVSDCILIKNNELTPIGKYKDFKLIDLRN